MGSTQGYEHYDLICLGSGVASKVLAWTIGPIPGKRCAVIERKWLGGSCPNVACMPSKNVIHSAKVADLNAHGYLYGLPKRNASPVDMRAVIQRKDDMVLESSKAHQENFDKAGVDLIWGNGRFIGKRTIEVTNQAGEKRTLTADHVVIDTGSRAAFNKIPGLVEAEPMSHVEMLDLKVVPSHLIIIGGGYVGLEFAQAMRRFGAEVTVLDRNPRILKKEDNDVATDLQETLEAEGVVFSVSTSISQIGGKCGGEVMISGTRAGEKFEIRGSHILYAAGRIPNNDGIGLELAGVEITETGHVKVNEHNETSSEGVFAVGDCANSPHFTHIGFDDFRIVRDRLLGKELPPLRKSHRQVPYVLFTNPEFAHCGLRENEAEAKGIKYRLAKIPMAAFLRTLTSGETAGFAKALISAEDDTILGFSAVGAGVGELLPVVQLAMKRGLPYTDISELVITHPTLNEGLGALFSVVPKL